MIALHESPFTRSVIEVMPKSIMGNPQTRKSSTRNQHVIVIVPPWALIIACIECMRHEWASSSIRACLLVLGAPCQIFKRHCGLALATSCPLTCLVELRRCTIPSSSESPSACTMRTTALRVTSRASTHNYSRHRRQRQDQATPRSSTPRL